MHWQHWQQFSCPSCTEHELQILQHVLAPQSMQSLLFDVGLLQLRRLLLLPLLLLRPRRRRHLLDIMHAET